MNKMFSVFALVFFPVFAVYLYTSVPAITQDDSGELAGAGATLGTAHPPGYPLYCLAAKAFTAAVPLGNNAYRVNLASSLLIAAAGAAIALAVFGASASFAGALALGYGFSFSSYVWAMANVTEVYGIAAVITALLWLVMARSRDAGGIKYFYLVMFLFGAGLSAHYTIGLLAPGIACWMLFNRDRLFGEKWSMELLKGFLWSLAGFSSVLYIFIRAGQDPLFGWEDPKTLERFWQVVARSRYGLASLAQGGAPNLSIDMITGKLGFYFAELYRNFSWAGAALFAAGIYKYGRDKRLGWPLFALIIGSGPGFVLLANAGLDAASRELMARFFFLSFLFAALVMAGGLAYIPKRFKSAVLALPLILLWQNAPALNHRQEYLYYDHGKNILKTLPQASLLFSDRADEMEFAVAWLHIAEGLRPDMTFVDCNAGATRSVYGDAYYRVWGKPRLQIREAAEKAMIEKHSASVYYATFYPNMINIPRFREGVLFRAKPVVAKTSAFPYEEVYAFRVPKKISEGRVESLVLSYYQLLGEYCLEAGALEAARHYFSGVSAYDRSGTWNMSLAYALHSRAMPGEAFRYYQKAIDKGVATADAYTNAGAILEAKGDKELAKRYFTAAIALSPGSLQAHFNLASLYWKEGNWAGVIKEFEQVLLIDPANGNARKFLASAKARHNK